MKTNQGAACVFSVDVEDWFHILGLPGSSTCSEWETFPSRVERNFLRLLDLLDQHLVSSTCFFLGWVAQKYPRLVREAFQRKHEIASHGNKHRLIYEMSRSEFREDASSSRKLLEDISGASVDGFRAPGFSVTPATSWFFETLLEAGFRYDSSVFPARHGHGGMPGAARGPHFIGELLEFPITVASVLGRPACFFGGGYLRLSPLPVIRAMAAQVLDEGRPIIFYVHPREIDSSQPRLPMPLHRRFKSYVNIASTERKITSLLAEFKFDTFGRLSEQYVERANCWIDSPQPRVMAGGA
ncbi:MAG TPA: XrtA system polysaccharide deacetylase [Bryobacteraceae bacterium]|nr:XrtA system polysaccharide deacetylase [Bryobacteraceae bacterium]